MKEYITKDRAKQFVCGHCNEVCSEEPCEPSDCDWMAFIDKEPAADVAEVRHAKWVDNHCTACGMMPMGDEMWKNRDFEPPLFERFMDYCPNCGAIMDKERSNNYLKR